jgi:tetratricopeptide (TPR) repeat protein
MKTKIKYLLILACFGFTACNDFLDERPKGNFIPASTEHFEGMLNNRIVISYSDFDYSNLISDDVWLPEMTAMGQAASPLNMYWARTELFRRIYNFNPRPFHEGENDMFWSEAHKRLLHFNSVIENALTSVGTDDAKKRAIRAEALLQRSLEFLGLVNLYAHHYDPATAATEPGIPMRLYPDASVEIPRSSVQEVYDRILKDLYEALPNLPKVPANRSAAKFRATHTAGLALLARVYFYMGNYGEALKYANLTLEQNSALVDLNDWVARKGPPFGPLGFPPSPVGWVVTQAGTPIPNAKDCPETILARNFLRPYGLWTDCAMSKELLALFDQTNDKRIEQWYGNGWPPGQDFLATHGTLVRLRGDDFSNGLNTPEMYLIRAECYARDNQLQAALDDVNKLRKHRYATGTHEDKILSDFGGDAFEVLKFVLEERRRELAFMGFRTIDLKRLNKDPRFAKTITRTVVGQEISLPPNSNRYLRQLWPDAAIWNPHWSLNPETD